MAETAPLPPIATAPDARNEPESRVGSVVGGYELTSFAAAGGMGWVYRARDLDSGAIVAVKILAHGVDDKRFAREAEVLADIDHPGVVRHVGHGVSASGERYLAMEWLEGEDLAERLRRGVLSPADTLIVAKSALDALGAAHARGVVHRDLKPANLFLLHGELGVVKLLDFGIARTRTGGDLTLGNAVGTPAFMAPEQVRGDPIDARVDIYGLGAVMFSCLAGVPPFRGSYDLAVLAKVLLEPAPSIRDLRFDVSEALAALVARTLAKDPAERPADARALAEEIGRVAAADPSAVATRMAAITSREQRVACVLLCATSAGAEDVTTSIDLEDETAERTRVAVEAEGGVVQAIGGGVWVVTFPDAQTSADQAASAASAALGLVSKLPGSPVFIATGRVLVGAGHQVGEVIDRAADALVDARKGRMPAEVGADRRARGGAFVDAATAELLASRFHVRGEGAWRQLVDEPGAITAPRTLLGKPAVCVGRGPELALIAAALRGGFEETRASLVLVTAPPGLGKSRFVNELLREAKAAHAGLDVLFAASDRVRAASPFAVAADLLKRAASEDEANPDAALDALVARDFSGEASVWVRELLGEIAGAPTPLSLASPGLRAARADASIMADALGQAWSTWLERRAAKHPVLIVIEDAHFADAPSMRLVGEALTALSDRPLCVIATARPRPVAGDSLDRLRGHRFVEVTLGPLSAQASERVVRGALGEAADEALVRAIVRRASGHPFHLEELVRAVAQGRGADALPDSVLAMLQARLDQIGPEARRLLRAASVFGDAFTPAGVAALLGGEASESSVGSSLAHLVEQEVVSKRRGVARAPTYEFRHSLLRDAAYATLADADRVRAHLLAGEWLEQNGETDAGVLAEHFDRGAAPDRALPLFRRAAAEALAQSDFDRATSHVARARALNPGEATLASLSAVEADIDYWRGDFTRATESATFAAARLDRATPEWFHAVAVVVGALGQRGENDDVARWLREVARASPPPEARSSYVVALCRGMTQLYWAHHGDELADVRARLDTAAEPLEGLDSFPLGWVHRVRGESAWLHARNVGLCLSELDASLVAFERARAVRAVCLTRLNAAALTAWSGDSARGLALVETSRGEAQRLRAGFLLRYGRVVEAVLFAFAGHADAEPALRSSLAEVVESPRLAFLCRIFLGLLALERGDVDAAAIEAESAELIVTASALTPGGLALTALVRLARGDAEGAARAAAEGERIEREARDLELTQGLASLALAEAHRARGDLDAARFTIRDAMNRLASIAATLPTMEQRTRFFQRRFANDRIARFAAELGVENA